MKSQTIGDLDTNTDSLSSITVLRSHIWMVRPTSPLTLRVRLNGVLINILMVMDQLWDHGSSKFWENKSIQQLTHKVRFICCLTEVGILAVYALIGSPKYKVQLYEVINDGSGNTRKRL